MSELRKLDSYSVDYSFQLLELNVSKGTLIIQPDFQRKYVWDRVKASKFIESALMQIPLPACYFGTDVDGNLLVIDGLQRITSIVEYLRNLYPLSGLEHFSNLNEKHFKDLGSKDQRALENYFIRCVILRDSNYILISDLFSRLNQGAVSLSDQEIRHAIFQGTLDDLIINISIKHKAELDGLLNKRGIGTERANEQEAILRFFALENLESYGKESMKVYLDKFMQKNKDLDIATITQWREKFDTSLETSKAIFKDLFSRNPTKNRKVKSWVYFDLQMWIVNQFDIQFILKNADKIMEKYIELCKDKEFNDELLKQTSIKTFFSKRRSKFYELVNSVVA